MEKLCLNDFREALSRVSFADNIYRMTDEELRSANLKEDLFLDSLDMLELTLELEISTRIFVPDIVDCKTVQDVLNACNNNA